ncbi:MAG: ParB/RepB/Spo0J family partition protein [Planctomycetota bacterium]
MSTTSGAADEGESTTGTPSVGEWIDLSAIRRNADQPRKTFDSAALEELRQSIAEHGVLQPITVRRVDDGYQIVAGERRWRAARSAGLDRIPAIVRDEVSDGQSLELAIVENVQRQDLDPVEKARGYQALMDRCGLTQEEVAERVGVKRATVANQLRLLDLPDEARDAVSRGLITMGHAKALLGLRDEGAIRKALGEVVRKDLSVRATERLAQGGERRTSPSPSAASQTPAWVNELESRLRETLGVKVTLRNGAGYRGSIILDYADRQQLETLCDRLAPRESL